MPGAESLVVQPLSKHPKTTAPFTVCITDFIALFPCPDKKTVSTRGFCRKQGATFTAVSYPLRLTGQREQQV